MLDGTHALVTGGGTGIGAAIARALADQGAMVTITGRRAAPLDAMRGPRLSPRLMDVRDETSVREATAEAVRAHGPVQICIVNAAIAEQTTLPETSLEAWRETMSTNLDGAFLTIRESLRSMLDQDWGRVIAISSVAGLRGMKRATPYVASKHGLVGLIRALAEDHLGRPHTFNALCPAYVETEIVPRNIEQVMARDGLGRAEATALVHAANRHGRLIAPEEIAGAVLWLCGPQSGSINGQAIEIAGGQF